MNYPDSWPCECGASKAQHEALKISYHPMDNLTYAEWENNRKESFKEGIYPPKETGKRRTHVRLGKPEKGVSINFTDRDEGL